MYCVSYLELSLRIITKFIYLLCTLHCVDPLIVYVEIIF